MKFLQKAFIIPILCLTILISSIVTASAATFAISPSTQTFPRQCNRTVNILINATGQSANAAEVFIDYNTSEVTIIDSNSSFAGTQVRTGDAFETYIYNQVDTGAGRIRLAGASFVGFLTSEKVFGSIEFTTTATTNSTTFTIFTNPSNPTVDSNIADSSTNLDLLSGTTNATYTFVSGPCNPDTQGPNITINSPQNGATGVPLDSNVTITMSDNQSGVDLASVEFTINGVRYTILDSEVTYTENNGVYTFIINPRDDFPADEATTIIARASDLDGNRSSRQAVINVPTPPGLECPIEEPENCLGDQITINELGDVINTIFSPGGGAGILDGTFLENTFLDDISAENGLAALVATTALIALGLNLLSLLAALFYPSSLFRLLSVFFARSSRRPWGVITDAISGKPIAFATCQLYVSGAQFKVDQTVSDLDGRYGFVIRSGQYRLEIKQSGFEKYVANIIIPDGQQGYVHDVKLVPIGKVIEGYGGSALNILSRIAIAYSKISPYIFAIGFAFSLLALIISFTLFNVIIFVLYFLLALGFLAQSYYQRSKYSAVVNAQNGLRIPYAQIKVYDTQTWQVVDSIVTNYNGAFDFYGDSGKYGLVVVAIGYKFPSVKNTYELVKGKYNSMILTNLSKGRNRLQIFVDPVNTTGVEQSLDQPVQQTQNIASPFG
jgi:hypothetical protein